MVSCDAPKLGCYNLTCRHDHDSGHECVLAVVEHHAVDSLAEVEEEIEEVAHGHLVGVVEAERVPRRPPMNRVCGHVDYRRESYRQHLVTEETIHRSIC